MALAGTGVTKKELLSALEHVPDHYEVHVQVNTYGERQVRTHSVRHVEIERVDPGVLFATVVVKDSKGW